MFSQPFLTSALFNSLIIIEYDKVLNKWEIKFHPLFQNLR